jgi:hypothetical protein
MYGVTSYMVLALANVVAPASIVRLGLHLQDLALLNPSAIEKSGIDPIPIAMATAIGLLLGLLIALNINYSLLMRLCRAIGLTKGSAIRTFGATC